MAGRVRLSFFKLGHAMLLQFVGATAIIVLFAGAALAQVPGDSPSTGVGSAVAGSRGLGIISRPLDDSWQNHENERSYRETVKRIPDKRPSKDPWKTVRQALRRRSRIGIGFNNGPPRSRASMICSPGA